MSPLATMEKKNNRMSNGLVEVEEEGDSSDNISIDQDDENNGSSKY